MQIQPPLRASSYGISRPRSISIGTATARSISALQKTATLQYYIDCLHMPFVTTPDTEAHQKSRPGMAATLSSSGHEINMPTSTRLSINMGRSTTGLWDSNMYLSSGLTDMYNIRQFEGLDEDTSDFLPAYSSDQQSPVDEAETALTSYQLYHLAPSISRQQNTYDYGLMDSGGPIANIDPQLQWHHAPQQYIAYGGTRTVSQPSSTHNSPISTSRHSYGPISVSASPSHPLPLSRPSMGTFCQQTSAQQTALYGREAESETESQKSTSDIGKTKAFLRKGRSGTVYTVCPKQVYKCLYDLKCKATTQKACDIKDHYYSVHAQFNCMQCNSCGNSYARACTYKRHLKEDKTCPKPRKLTAEQEEQGRLRKEIMDFFADMTNEELVKRGVKLMKECNMRVDMKKRKRRIGCYRKPDADDADEEDPKGTGQMVTACAGAGSQFTAVNAHHRPYFPQSQSQAYPFHDSHQLFEFSSHNAVPDITPRNCDVNHAPIDSLFEFEGGLNFE